MCSFEYVQNAVDVQHHYGSDGGNCTANTGYGARALKPRQLRGFRLTVVNPQGKQDSNAVLGNQSNGCQYVTLAQRRQKILTATVNDGVLAFLCESIRDRKIPKERSSLARNSCKSGVLWEMVRQLEKTRNPLRIES